MMTRVHQTGCFVFRHQAHRPRNLNEEAFDTEYQDRDQGRECVLHIGAKSPFVKPVRLVGWGNGQDECQSK